MVPNFVSIVSGPDRRRRGRRIIQNKERPISQYVKPTTGIEHDDTISVISKPQIYFSSVLNSAKKTTLPANIGYLRIYRIPLILQGRWGEEGAVPGELITGSEFITVFVY